MTYPSLPTIGMVVPTPVSFKLILLSISVLRTTNRTSAAKTFCLRSLDVVPFKQPSLSSHTITHMCTPFLPASMSRCSMSLKRIWHPTVSVTAMLTLSHPVDIHGTLIIESRSASSAIGGAKIAGGGKVVVVVDVDVVLV